KRLVLRLEGDEPALLLPGHEGLRDSDRQRGTTISRSAAQGKTVRSGELQGLAEALFQGLPRRAAGAGGEAEAKDRQAGERLRARQREQSPRADAVAAEIEGDELSPRCGSQDRRARVAELRFTEIEDLQTGDPHRLAHHEAGERVSFRVAAQPETA